MKKWYAEEYEFQIEVTGFLRGNSTERFCRNGEEIGDRYTCMIQGKERELWFEDGRWFVAAKVAVSQAPPSNA